MSPDAELLRRYVRLHDERAFADLVQRHLGLVYSAALRRTGGRVQFAEDISQKVFGELARRAAQLDGHPALVGWLYRCTRNAAIDVMRAEESRQRNTEAFVAMQNTERQESAVEWEQLRPVLDAAMDGLKECDRELMLLRYFQGLSFAEVGTKLKVSENAARMRADRALDRLRSELGRRGITSTTSALGLLLANQAFAAAPAELALTVTSAALSAGPIAGGFLAFFPMNNLIAPVVSAALAAGVTSVAWTTFASTVSQDEIAALQAENAALTQAASGADSRAAATIADTFAAQAATITQSVGRRVAGRSAAAAGHHQNLGKATPHDALMSFAWASDTGDVAVLAKLLWLDDTGRMALTQIYDGLPAALRAQYTTPEEFLAFLFIADTLLSPVPGADVVARQEATELKPDRVALRPPGVTKGGLEFQKTAEGWKSVVPGYYPKILAARIFGSEMLAGLNHR